MRVLYDVRHRLAGAGLTASAITRIERRWRIPSAHWLADRIAFAPGMAAMIGALGPARPRVLNHFVAALERDQGEGEVELAAVAHIGIGEKSRAARHHVK
jgi:hypothetical protein